MPPAANVILAFRRAGRAGEDADLVGGTGWGVLDAGYWMLVAGYAAPFALPSNYLDLGVGVALALEATEQNIRLNEAVDADDRWGHLSLALSPRGGEGIRVPTSALRSLSSVPCLQARAADVELVGENMAARLIGILD